MSLSYVHPEISPTKMSKYLANLTVMYAEKEYLQPDEVVAEIQGQSSDINYEFGGKFVWLHPEWTSAADEAISDLSFERSSTAVRNYNDIAMGAGGDFRYIKASYGGSSKVTKAGLLRTDENLSEGAIVTRIQQSGFTHHSGDINGGRGKSYLYLVWAY
ncbi:hypothetical protein BDV28DRAFT_135549 [Aspergillus coremiiformis]|uniref:Uncharacterized protein n=1 Tax=Aspergillus coremiiformis TaxID=138285 RepID=A0A5N6Z3I3_9EURO|nr:hypothetical protein BDV28DRAFT_135549 [Aspergillus coremiiformis]